MEGKANKLPKKGYRLWCIKTHKFIVIRDVTFNEKVLPLKTEISRSQPQEEGLHFEVELDREIKRRATQKLQKKVV